MHSSSLFAPLLGVTLALATPALAADAGKAPNAEAARRDASIPFAHHGGIQNWQAEGDSVIYVESQANQWFKATLMSPAIDLPFVQALGFDASPGDTLDKFGGITVGGRQYPFSTFEPSDPPKGQKGAKPAPKPAG